MFDVPKSITAIPKVDLHVHSESAPRIDRLEAVVSGRQPYDWSVWNQEIVLLPPEERLRRINGWLDADRFEELDQDDRYFLARVADALEEAAREGAAAIELRFGPVTAFRPNLMSLFKQAESLVQSSWPQFRAGALVCVWPDKNDAALLEACLAHRQDGLVGIDFLPRPYHAQVDWSMAFAWAEKFADAGLGITAHAGEFSLVNLGEALKLPGLTRIGHGIKILESPSLTEIAIEKGIVLECCLTSNVTYGAVESLESHPLPSLVHAGLRVSINTDNPVKLATSITQEYALARRMGLSMSELKGVAQNAWDASFLNPQVSNGYDNGH